LARIDPGNSNNIIEAQLDTHLSGIEKVLDADVLTFCGQILHGIEDLLRDSVEEISNRKPRLVVLLETSGGYIEVVQRIVTVFRHHYTTVDYVIPNYAMSAGTVLAMSGDAIYMDYFSVLGPIDPQVEHDGRLIPALGYIAKYKELIDKSAKGKLTTAEITYLISKFDPAELYYYERAKELSNSLLKDWLVRYKFKNWKETKTRKVKVTEATKKKRAGEIADMLNDTKVWNSHGRGISMAVLENDVKLQIEDFGANKPMNDAVTGYHRLLRDYMMKRGNKWVIHTRERYAGLA